MNAPIALQRQPSSARHNAQDAQPAYVLHSYPFKETSLVVEVFSRHWGRLPLVARGARRPRSALRGVLLAFQPLSLGWAGKSEIRTLHHAEWQSGHALLQGRNLLCGLYLNELLLRLLHRDDPHEGLYITYDQALHALRAGQAQAAVLRRFEKNMLRELGYGLQLDHDVQGEPLREDLRYTYLVERGAAVCEQGSAGDLELSGRTLLDMAQDRYDAAETLQQSRALMRQVLDHYLGGKPLHTRQLLREPSPQPTENRTAIN